jgi:hypothetical protein
MGQFGRITSVADLPPDTKLRGFLRKAATLDISDKPARARPATNKSRRTK